MFVVISTFFTSNVMPWKHSFRLFMDKDGSQLHSFGMTPALRVFAEQLHQVEDDTLRYQQLLHIAQSCPPMGEEYKTLKNKVPGCLSSVYVHAVPTAEGKIAFLGDSDALMTKGLVTMLVTGLSGNTVEDIERVDPKFIDYAGVGSSLSPSRNNGFLNMLHLMKAKAREVHAQIKIPNLEEESNVNPIKKEVEASTVSERPIFDAISSKLKMLQPESLTVKDVSAKHAGHASTPGNKHSETHFKVAIVAECFANLSRVQRHQLVYTLLDDELQNGLHALSISADAPNEV